MNDIPKRPGELAAAFVLSDVAIGDIKKIDPSEALVITQKFCSISNLARKWIHCLHFVWTCTENGGSGPIHLCRRHTWNQQFYEILSVATYCRRTGK